VRLDLHTALVIADIIAAGQINLSQIDGLGQDPHFQRVLKKILFLRAFAGRVTVINKIVFYL
jgi:hypothetical protein